MLSGMVEELRLYFLAVLSSWIGIATAIYGAIELLFLLTGKQIPVVPPKWRLGIAVVLIFCAQFVVWRGQYERRNQEHTARIIAEGGIKKLEGEAAERDKQIEQYRDLLASRPAELVQAQIVAPPVAPLKQRVTQLSADILAFYSSRNVLGATSHPSGMGETASLFSDKFLPSVYMLKQELRERGITDPVLEMAVQIVSDQGWMFPESIKTIGESFAALAPRLPDTD